MSLPSPSSDGRNADQPDGNEQRAGSALGSMRFFAFVFIPFAMGHFLSYVLRSINAVLAPLLSSSFSLDTGQIGIFTSAYFFAFAVAQLPVGLSLDRYGPRRVQICLLLVAAIGCVWLATAHSFIELVAARTLTGVGLAACFMASLKAVAEWLPPSRMPSMNSYFLAVGGLGAIASTLPAQLLTDALGWSGVFTLIAVAIVVTALAIWLITPEPSDQARRVSPTLLSLLEVYRNAAFLRTISIALLPHTVYFAVQGLWLGTWLHEAAGLDAHNAALYLLAGMITMVISTIIVGRFAEWAARRGYQPIDIAAAGLWLFAVAQLFIILAGQSYPLAAAILFPLLGSFAGLEFAIVAQSVPRALTGRASTSLNLLVFTGSFVIQSGFGALLKVWPVQIGEGRSHAAYQLAFGVLLALQMPGLIAWALRKAWSSAAFQEHADERPAE